MAPEFVLETERLLLRHWKVDDAPLQRELWTERDPVSRPIVGSMPKAGPRRDLEDWIRRRDHSKPGGLLAVVRSFRRGHRLLRTERGSLGTAGRARARV